VLIGAVGVLLLVLIIIVLQALYYRSEMAETVEKVYRAVPEEWARVKAEQEAKLHSYRLVDEAQGIVAIPIARAIELMVKEAGAPPADAPEARP
jgi:hypothetical protein